MIILFLIRLASEDVPVSIVKPIVTIAIGKSSIRTIVQIAKRKEQPRYLEALIKF